MPRHPRLFIPGATYHVYCRVARGEFVFNLPWWTQANHVDEIADADCHPDATTFDGQRLAEERAELDLGEFAFRFEVASGYSIGDLASRFRSSNQTHGRIVFSTLAASRYGFRVCDIAALIGKHANSVTKWLTEGLRRKGVDTGFKNQIDSLDAAISRHG